MSKNALQEPTIIENRSTKTSKKDRLEEMYAKTFAEEIENDKEKSAIYIKRASDAEAKYGQEDPRVKQEVSSSRGI